MSRTNKWGAGALAAAVLSAPLAHAQAPAARPPAAQAEPGQTKPALAPDAPKSDAPKSDATVVEEVTVSGARAQVETTIDRRSYSVADDLQGKTGTLSDVLRNVPSVQVDVNGNVSLRGDPNVTVLLDGRPSAQFTRETLAQALQALPADQIDRIEVLTNPSAEFRADGAAGIINLVTKKAKGVGPTGSLRAGGSSSGNYDASLSNGFNSNKLSVVDSLSYRHGRGRGEGVYDTGLTTGGGSREILAQAADMDMVQGRAAADYDLDAKTRISAGISGAWQEGTQRIDDDYTQVNAAQAPVLVFERDSVQDITAKNAQVDATLRKRWSDTHTLVLNTVLSTNEGLTSRVDLTTPALPAGAPFAVQVGRDNYNRRAALTADYQKPLSGAQLKAGFLVEEIDNLIQHSGGSGTSPGAITVDPAQKDNFSDVETHANAYVTLQKKFGDLTALGGLRVESVQLDLDRLTADVQYEQDYERFYPTLHLSYALGEGRNLIGSYSKRVQRPIPMDLDPRPYSPNANVVVVGNPYLTPQDTDAYELIYETRKGPAFTLLTAYHRQTNNAFSFVFADLGGGVIQQSRANLGSQSNTGVEWAMGNRLTPKITYNFSLNAYQTEISGSGLGPAGDSSAFAGFGRANVNWQVTPKDFIQLNLFANSKQLFPQGYSAPMASGNIGYRRNVTDKVSLMLVIQDPFETIRNKLVLDTPTGRVTRIQRSNSRAATLTLVWSFAGKPREAGFDFGQGGAPAGGGLP